MSKYVTYLKICHIFKNEICHIFKYTPTQKLKMSHIQVRTHTNTHPHKNTEAAKTGTRELNVDQKAKIESIPEIEAELASLTTLLASL